MTSDFNIHDSEIDKLNKKWQPFIASEEFLKLYFQSYGI